MRSLLTVAALAVCAASGFSATPAAPTKHEAMVAIDVLERNVSGKEAVEAARTVVTYAQLSDDVMVNIGPDQVPWVTEKWGLDDDRELECQSLLLASFVAGNVRSQIKNDRAEDDTYSGWVFAIKSYDRLRAKEHFRSDSMDALSKMEADGTLLQHAKEISAPHSDKDEPQGAQPAKPYA
jgi:hypothetical protein